MGTYRPPEVQEGWDPFHPLWRHYTAKQGMSVIKRAGTWTAVRVLAHEEILDLTEGADYFVGGYVYEDVAPAVLAELSAAGIGTVEE